MRDRLLSIVLALLALALFAGIFVPPKPQQSNSMPHTLDKGEQGLAALFQWLSQRKLPVVSWRERWSALHERYHAGHVLVSHYPFRMQDEKTGDWRDAPNAYTDQKEISEVVRWIAAGNTLVLALSALDAEGNTATARADTRNNVSYLELLDDVGWELTGSASGAYEEDADDSEEKDSAPDTGTEEDTEEDSQKAPSTVARQEAEIAVANARPQALHRLELGDSTLGGAPLAFEALAWEPQGSTGLAFSPLNSADECAPSASEVSKTDIDPANERIDAQGNTVATEALISDAAPAVAPSKALCIPRGVRAALVILRSARDQSPAGWWLPFGRGGIVVLGYGSLWKNPNLLRSGNALASETLLRRFVKPGGSILFDDYRYGLSALYDPNALLSDPRLYKTLLIAGIFWLMYAIGRSRRLLPVRLLNPRPSSATFARAIADFYARSLSEPELAATLGEHFLARARRAFGVRGSNEAVWQRLNSEPSIDTAALESLQSLSFGAAQGRDNPRLTQLIVALERGFRS
jgi:hypothetical protein